MTGRATERQGEVGGSDFALYEEFLGMAKSVDRERVRYFLSFCSLAR